MIDLSYFLDTYNWSFEGLVAMLLVVMVYLFFVKSTTGQKFSFAIAIFLIYLVLCSPIADLTSFGLHSVSMLQHIMLLMIAPILILKAIPSGFLKRLRMGDGAVFANPKKYFLGLWVLSAVVMWGGHFLSAAIMSAETGTAICGIALPSGSWVTNIPEGLIFATLFIAGILFLLPVLHPDISKRLSPVSSVIYLFTACISCSLLGLYVAFSAGSASLAEALPVFATLRNPVPMSLRVDQQMAGMLMWVPGCIIYVITSVEIILHWYDDSPVVETTPAVEVNLVINENTLADLKMHKTVE